MIINISGQSRAKEVACVGRGDHECKWVLKSLKRVTGEVINGNDLQSISVFSDNRIASFICTILGLFYIETNKRKVKALTGTTAEA